MLCLRIGGCKRWEDAKQPIQASSDVRAHLKGASGHRAEMRFDAENGVPALSVEMSWVGGPAPQILVPELNRSLHEVVAKCLIAGINESRPEASWVVKVQDGKGQVISLNLNDAELTCAKAQSESVLQAVLAHGLSSLRVHSWKGFKKSEASGQVQR